MVIRQNLPIDPYLSQILSILESNQNLVIRASPGSGKTTRVPPALLGAQFRKLEQEIIVLVPRRLAAKMGALRVAEERGEEIGETIGYQFRFENRTGPKTRLKYLTEGMLLRQLISSPTLPKAGIVLLDEFHERHLHSDVALSYLRHLQQQQRPDLKIIVMSATLDTEELSDFLGHCPVLKIDAPVYPVAIEYLQRESDKRLEDLIVESVLITKKEKGDCLVFLPGMAEILRCSDTLTRRVGADFMVLPLHGDLPREEQEKIFKKFDKRKIILATNVAETSLTIDGVTTVIDSGLHRQASFSWWSGVPALKTRPISQASAIQRAGRAGRTAPGKAIRLYTEHDFKGRSAFELPEIRRADLTQTILEIKALGLADLSSFPWFEPPSSDSLSASLILLYNLGALSDASPQGLLTALGHRMVELPLHPRLSRMLIEAESKGVLEDAIRMAALISEDELDDLDAMECVGRKGYGEQVRRLVRQLKSYLNVNQKGDGDLAYCLLTGFPDRVAKKRGGTKKTPEADLVFCFGGSGTVSLKDPVPQNDYFVILDIQEKKRLTDQRSKVHVKSLCAIKPEWLFDLQTTFLQESSALEWEEKAGRVVQRTLIMYGNVILSESIDEPTDQKAAEKMFLRKALAVDLAAPNLGKLLEVLRGITNVKDFEANLARLMLLEVDTSASMIRFFEGCTSLKQLKEIDFSNRLFETIPPQIAGRLHQWFPESIPLPSGRRAKIHYELGKKPWIESRLQDFFGMKEGPVLLDGKLPLTLHLLAPNKRPVQVTQDLASFWKNTYPEIRKQLSRRYPRHAWPEDPLILPPRQQQARAS